MTAKMGGFSNSKVGSLSKIDTQGNFFILKKDTSPAISDRCTEECVLDIDAANAFLGSLLNDDTFIQETHHSTSLIVSVTVRRFGPT